MTYEQIEKEFDEYFKGNILDNKLHCNTVYVKSFLKQSFIKYLQSEVKDAENKIRFIGGETYCVFCKLHRAAGECNCDGWNEAKIDQITHITNQIKELEV